MLLDTMLMLLGPIIIGVVVLLIVWAFWRTLRAALFVLGYPWRAWRLSSGWLIQHTLQGLTARRVDPITWTVEHSNLSAMIGFANARTRQPGTHALSIEIDLSDHLPSSLRFESSLGFQRQHYLGDQSFDASFVCIQGVDIALAMLTDELRHRLTSLLDVPEYIGWHHLSLRNGHFHAHVPMSALDAGVTAHKLQTLLRETQHWCLDVHQRMASDTPQLLLERFSHDPEALWQRHCLLSLLTQHRDTDHARLAFASALEHDDIRYRFLCYQHASDWMTPAQRHNVQIHAILDLPIQPLRLEVCREVLKEHGLHALQDQDLPLLVRSILLETALTTYPHEDVLRRVEPLIDDASPWERPMWLRALHKGRTHVPHQTLQRWLTQTQGDDLTSLLSLIRLNHHPDLEPTLQDILSWSTTEQTLDALDLLADLGSPRVTGFVDRLGRSTTNASVRRRAHAALTKLRARHSASAHGALTLEGDSSQQLGELSLQPVFAELTLLEDVVLDLETVEVYTRTSQPHNGPP